MHIQNTAVKVLSCMTYRPTTGDMTMYVLVQNIIYPLVWRGMLQKVV